jgi:shikimate dehydrogenase
MRFGVVGDPIAHSKSPAMHAAAFRAMGLAHSYEAVRATSEELPAIVQALREGEWDGLNVTIPHKRAALALADEVDPSAALVGAANTLVRGPRGVVALNTDVPALAEELRALAPDRDWRRANALVLGSGGAARAAIVALAVELGAARVAVRARRAGDAFAAEMRGLVSRAGSKTTLASEPLGPSRGTEASLAAVVQCTSAGMAGADPGDAIAAAVSWSHVPPGAVALDVVYAPPETPFLQAAEARGLRAANGLGMLARQGAIAQRHWLGLEPPLDAMLASLK